MINGLHPAVKDAASEISSIYHERDELKTENVQLKNDKAIAEGMVVHLKEQLEKITSERDHYMRYSYALATRINAAQDIFTGIMELSQHEAINPGPEQQRLPAANNLETKPDA